MCRLTFKPIYHGRLSSKADRGAIGKGEVGSLNELDLRPSGCHLSKDPVWSYKWKAERALKHWTKHPAETETARGRPPPLQDGDCANSRAIILNLLWRAPFSRNATQMRKIIRNIRKRSMSGNLVRHFSNSPCKI